MLMNDGSRNTSFSLEVWQEAVSGGCQDFHQKCRFCRALVSVQQNNNYMVHTNTKLNIVKYCTKSM